MSKTIEHLYTLYNNPFYLTPLIVKFYEKYEGKQERDILLSYIIFPIALYEDSKEILVKKYAKRDIRMFLNFNRKESQSKKSLSEIKKNNKLFGLPDRVDEFKELTNLCLQYAFDKGCLKLNDDLSISFVKFDFERDNTLVEFLAVSENLALMLKKERITHIYMKLGIKNL